MTVVCSYEVVEKCVLQKFRSVPGIRISFKVCLVLQTTISTYISVMKSPSNTKTRRLDETSFLRAGLAKLLTFCHIVDED